MVDDLWRFVRALFHHWIPLLTGGAIMAALGVIEHRIGTSVPWPYYAAAILFCFLYSCFAAWRDEFRARAELEERARPKLSIHFRGTGQRPEVQELGPQRSQRSEWFDQRLFRIAVRNDSTGSIAGAQVVLEAVESEHSESFFPGHGLRVMGRHDTSPRFDIAANATQWVDLVGYVLCSSGEYYYLPYAELGEQPIPRGRHALLLRADGGGLPSRARVVVNCPEEGKFEVAEFTNISGESFGWLPTTCSCSAGRTSLPGSLY